MEGGSILFLPTEVQRPRGPAHCPAHCYEQIKRKENGKNRFINGHTNKCMCICTLPHQHPHTHTYTLMHTSRMLIPCLTREILSPGLGGAGLTSAGSPLGHTAGGRGAGWGLFLVPADAAWKEYTNSYMGLYSGEMFFSSKEINKWYRINFYTQ